MRIGKLQINYFDFPFLVGEENLHTSSHSNLTFILKGKLNVYHFEYPPEEGMPLPPVHKKTYGRFRFIQLPATKPVSAEALKPVKALMFLWLGKKYNIPLIWKEVPGVVGKNSYPVKNDKGEIVGKELELASLGMVAEAEPYLGR